MRGTSAATGVFKLRARTKVSGGDFPVPDSSILGQNMGERVSAEVNTNYILVADSGGGGGGCLTHPESEWGYDCDTEVLVHQNDALSTDEVE